MILASCEENDCVLDTFSGSGITLRVVCQQLNRHCTGIELNPGYIVLTKKRLEQPFSGFDNIDQRMERIPNDLNDTQIRNEYLDNHKIWFLKYHADMINSFKHEHERKYGDKNIKLELFDDV
jgi:site-specific DNA-methyltransferase (adenine-specific)